MKKLFVIAVSLVVLVGCGEPNKGDGSQTSAGSAPGSSLSKAYCQKGKECCSQNGENACDYINSTGAMERCVLFEDEFITTLETYRSAVCDKARTAHLALRTCLSQIGCNDINPDDFSVAKCQAQAVAACNALKDANESCYYDVSSLDCSTFGAYLDY